ncbi:hypothetical protein [Saccharothrix sp. HUAS TT1]|uniref:hypothetical protein n=1 Tax=unclassified Saccharothrix TaxID=2593673 RepID=UPI00345BE74C
MDAIIKCLRTPGDLMTGVRLVSGAAHLSWEKSARDRHAFMRGVERVQLIQVPAPYAPTVVPTQNVAPSAQERST